MEPKVIVIAGPTCSGKTQLSLIISEKIDCEIISADSRQIYKYLDIGTAKPSEEQLKKAKHHFINIFEPDEEYNISRFEIESLESVENILSKNKTPMVVGGSGLYIRALVDGIFNSVDTDDQYREQLLEKRGRYGNDYLYGELKKVDPEGAAKMLPQNWKRIIRALEVFHLTGKPIGEFQAVHKREVKYNFIQYGLNWGRESLYRNIDRRVDKMIELGFVDEVKFILAKGFNKKLNSLNTVGYKEIISFLEGALSLDEAISLIKRNTRRYAKRQMTWFRADNRIQWFEIDSPDDLSVIPGKIINHLLS